jgi:cytochrome P450
MAAVMQVPKHIPETVVRDFDFQELHGEEDVYASWKKVQDEYPDVFFTPRNGGHWVATRHADIDYMLQHYELFSSAEQMIPKAGKVGSTPPTDMDPPVHTEFRKLLAPFFTAKAIGALECRARELTISLIDEFYARGECEFIGDFARKMPVGIFLSMVNLPEGDRVELVELVEQIQRGKTPEIRQQGYSRLHEYLALVFKSRCTNPGEDILSSLVQSRVENGRLLTHAELLGMGVNLLGGGLDTVAASLGFWSLFLAHNPDHRGQIIENPQIIPAAVEELLRRFQVGNMGRVVVTDTNYKGCFLKAGDLILVATSCAGLDERRYPDPLAVDFDRADKRSLIFGRGPHQCLGQLLARTELRIFLEEWFKRIPHFEVKAGERPIAALGQSNTLQYLPLVWKC